jgi:hypothetical protein
MVLGKANQPKQPHRLLEAMDGRLYERGILFGLTKAYDVGDHNILLDKLHQYGFRGIIITIYGLNLT